MKKLFLSIVIAVIGFTTISAQGIKIGAKAGVNFADNSGDGELNEGTTSKTGIHLGGVVQLGIKEKFELQGELLYSMQGFKDGATHKLDYINLPITANYFVIESLSIQAGPQFGFNINDTFEDDLGSGSLNAEGFDLAVIFGAQYQFPTGLFVQGRYQLGLIDFLDYDSPSKHTVLSFSVGYFFY
ncbi:porin family protein [Spongiimicrobium sp. 2-473A-2-J]|uniref:porin family protein n=1 Tax=Eudoraea algarum TaxID=3417568 RepID=UPI003D36DBE3